MKTFIDLGVAPRFIMITDTEKTSILKSEAIQKEGQAMKNVFMKGDKHSDFFRDNLGAIKEGRGDLGSEMPVLVYRLMQYAMLYVLSISHGLEKANDYFRQAGFLVGSEFAKHTFNLSANFDTFVADLQKRMDELKIGILQMEAFNLETGDIIFTLEQYPDCLGLSITIENVCIYDEGFIAGILEAYTGKKYHVHKVDCWASDDKVCRFYGTTREK
jgi:predicted hydrocarbon binding protein